MNPCDNTSLLTLLVNAEHPYPFHRPLAPLVPFGPSGDEVYLADVCADALSFLIRAVEGEKDILPVSGYRSIAEQAALWEETVASHGEHWTKRYVALPGTSEHHTGLAVDLTRTRQTWDFVRPRFPHDLLGRRFLKHAADYGFILRYPKEKETITGIAYEPWHFRYVGPSLARYLQERAWTLEEYAIYEGAERSVVYSCSHNGGSVCVF